MELSVALLVLLAAVFHAAWNALVKIDVDRLIAMMLVSVGAALISLVCLPLVPPPAVAGWPYLAASVGLHVGYQLFLVRAYSHGDLGQVYPLARGVAPLIVTIVSVGLVGERLDPATLLAVLLLTAGVISLAFRGGRLPLRDEPRPSLYALATAVFIASYTVVDGVGARAAGTPHGYAAWLFALNGLPILAIALWRRRGQAWRIVRRHWPRGLLGGGLSLAAYWLVIWAMTQAPLAPVAALRETSVLFAALISVVMLKEGFGRWRLAATALVACGVALLRL